MHQIELPDLLGDMFDAMRVLGLVTNDFNRHDSIDSNASSASSTSSRVTALNTFVSSSKLIQQQQQQEQISSTINVYDQFQSTNDTIMNLDDKHEEEEVEEEEEEDISDDKITTEPPFNLNNN
jgi:hypothetical protein